MANILWLIIINSPGWNLRHNKGLFSVMVQDQNTSSLVMKKHFCNGKICIEDLIDYEDDGSDLSEYNVENGVSIDQKLDAFADGVSKLFIEQWPKRYIDVNKDIVSREESEHRLLIMFHIVTLIFGITTSSLLIVCAFKCINPNPLILEPNVETALSGNAFL